ncbi:uncharacterized protein LOC124158976 [Ischnura elegans]|uniref:uncharacterized protein LOC124158976 n=1 Tax=Ischnura elegans TaxID=197161 RepID=UPI001ED8AC9B|nr:uncharacterized protein LOC124158976 [Ischnura elegans]
MESTEVPENVSFKSYVIYDLETTTLPTFGIAKITEISAIGVMRDHILNLPEGDYQPRVVNKITLCINPCKMVSLEAENITGLSNDLLETSSPFNECVFGMLEDFINRLPQPVCLIAHNGKRFDFPILQSEVQRIGKKFSDHIWCADSLPAFQYLYLDGPRLSFIESQTAQSDSRKTNPLTDMLEEVSEMDSLLCDALDSAEKALQGEDVCKKSGQVIMTQEMLAPYVSSGGGNVLPGSETYSSVFSSPQKMSTFQSINETTPKRPVMGQFVPKVAKASGSSVQRYPITPSPEKNGSVRTSPKRKLPVRSLIKQFNESLVDRPNNFTLSQIFSHVCRKPPLIAHSAESDTIMLLQSIVACKSGFLQWVDKNSIPFNSVKPYRY